MTLRAIHPSTACAIALRPTATEKTMPRLLRPIVEDTLRAHGPHRRPAEPRRDPHEVDIVMDGQIVFSHAMRLYRRDGAVGFESPRA